MEAWTRVEIKVVGFYIHAERVSMAWYAEQEPEG
jgi:hypothetical protein